MRPIASLKDSLALPGPISFPSESCNVAESAPWNGLSPSWTAAAAMRLLTS
jgi:hypothetical protein